MNFYLLDDDKNIINILKLIIQNRGLGRICGSCTHAVDALEDIETLSPDIIIVDLLMPEMDGITFVKKARTLLPDTSFIMLSQVSSKDMISDAYESGVEFYIQKPINSIEVEAVIKNISQNLSMQRTMKEMHSIFNNGLGAISIPASSAAETDITPKLQKILQRLGISGDNGSKDIITLIAFLYQRHEEIGDITLSELCGRFTDSPKSMEQRIRRAANAGLVNLAHLGLEDYSNDIFNEYSNSLYNFEQVRREMDFIRGKSNRHGNVKIKNFLNSLLVSCQN